MIFAFIDVEKTNYPVRILCRVLEVSRSSFYAWTKRVESRRQKQDRAFVAHIKSVYRESRQTYGSPRIYDELRERGHRIGRHRIARLMRSNAIRPRQKKKFRVTTKVNPKPTPLL